MEMGICKNIVNRAYPYQVPSAKLYFVLPAKYLVLANWSARRNVFENISAPCRVVFRPGIAISGATALGGLARITAQTEGSYFRALPL